MATDPDHLAFFLSGTHVGIKAYTRHPNPRPEDRRIHRATPVIDSLARLLVDEENGQVFALSILPPSHTQQFTRVIVSANKSVPDKALAHVVYLLESFYDVRQSGRKLLRSGDSPGPCPKVTIPYLIPRDTDDPILSNLVGIEATIYRYSWFKMRKRLTKSLRHVAFERVCDAVTAPVDANRQALSQALEDGELQLQNPMLQGDVGLLRKLIAKLDKQLAGPPSSDEAVHDVRWTLAGLASVVESLPKESNLFGAFSTIHRQRVDFAHWMDKVLSTHKDFGQLVKIASSRTLEDILTSTVLASKTTPDPLPAEVPVTADTLRRALDSADVSEQALEDFLTKKFKSTKGQTVDIDGRIHCECAVLVELDKQWRAGEAIIHFIGMSKLSCSLCAYYFDAYCEATSQNIRTQGSRDEMDETDDEAVRKNLCERLKALLVDKVRAYEARVSPSSQSTTAADDGFLPVKRMSL
ncbi:hypothetical protein L226DRAFT_538544, partial [Lentinus tigrinus ALCF2SS1-7]